MKNNKIKIATQRGVLSLAASIWMTVMAIAFIGLTLMFTTYGPTILQMWVLTKSEQLCAAKGGTLNPRFPRCGKQGGGGGGGGGNKRPCCIIT